MSSETPATHLARLRVSYPAWRITRDIPEVTGSRGFTAVERATGRRLMAHSVAGLEAALMEQGQLATPGGGTH